jgi:hypothetical protein
VSEKSGTNGKYTTYALLLGQYVLHVAIPNLQAPSEPVYHVYLNPFQHNVINSSASVGNFLPKIFAIVSRLFGHSV